MKKILNYIAAGQGLGIRFLLIFSAITAFIFAVYIRTNGTELIPYAQDIADQMLPIKVENGIVVEPANTIKTAQLRIDENMSPLELPLVINTTVDTLNTAQLKSGVYLTRTTLYTVNNNEVRLYNLENDFELPQGDYRQEFKSVLFWAAIMVFIFGGLILFITYFILSIFYATCSYVLSAILSRKYDFDLRMRLSVLCLISAYIIFALLGWLGIETGKLVFFAVVIALQTLVIAKLPPVIGQENTIVPETADTTAVSAAWPEESKTAPVPVKAPAKKAPVKKKAPAKKKAAVKKPAAAAPKTTKMKKAAAPKKTTAK